MKKGLFFAALALAAAGSVWYLQAHRETSIPTTSSPATAKALDYAPADTAIFFGALRPLPRSDITRLLQALARGTVDTASIQHELEQTLARIQGAGAEPSPALRLIFGLYLEYLAGIGASPGLADTGLADPIDSAFYTQDALPVLRMRLGDEAAFDALIARAASRFGAKGESASRDGLAYQRYAFTSADAPKPLGLVVARHQGFAILTLDLGDLVPPKTFALALGKTRPAESLASTGKLERIAQGNGLLGSSIGFIDHVRLLRAITGPDDPLAQLFARLSDGEAEPALAAYRTPACRRDLEAMAALWPRTVFGYTRLDLQSSPVVADALMKVESTDGPLMKTLTALRGFLPAYGSGGESKIELKLGLNVDELAPALTALWTRASAATFACEPLLSAQAGLRGSNPAILGAMTGMARGLRGLGLAIQDIVLKPGASSAAEIDRIEGLVSVSSAHPEQIWGLLSLFNPDLAALALPADGEVTDLPLPPGAQIPRGLKLGRYGAHLVLFSGDKAAAAARSLADQPLASNGLYELHLDYDLFADLLAAIPDDALAGPAPATSASDAPSLASPGQGAEAQPQAAGKTASEEAREEARRSAPRTPVSTRPQGLAEMRRQFEQLRGIHIDMRLDFAPDGVTIGSRIQIPKDV